MSETHDTSGLSIVLDGDTTTIEGDGVIWQSAINEATVGSADFEYGRATAERGRTIPTTPNNQFDDAAAETAVVITAGRARVAADGFECEVSEHDFLYVPSGTGYSPYGQGGYTLTGVTDSVEFVWGSASHYRVPLYNDPPDAFPDQRVQVVRTHRDIQPQVSHEAGNVSRRWEAVYPETTGSSQLNAALFQRPPGSGMEVRGHAPPTISEAFTVLDGRMQITDHEGTEYVLERDDFLYVPPYGEHANANVGLDTLTYACIETPARSGAVSPSP